MQDPYVDAKNEVEDMLFAADRLVQKVKRAHDKGLVRELRSLLANLDEALEDVEETVKVVGVDPARFNISPHEYEQRKEFARRTRERLAGLQQQSDAFSASESQQMHNFHTSLGASSDAHERRVDVNDTDTHQLMAEQDLAMQRQNDELRQLGAAVGRIREMNHDINNEITEQDKVLDGMSKHMEQVTSKIKQTNKKIDKVIEKMSTTQQYVCIAVLAVILFILCGLTLS